MVDKADRYRCLFVYEGNNFSTLVCLCISMTTSQEVIKVLLSKYHIVDNPRKYALYEKTSRPGKTGSFCDRFSFSQTDSRMAIVHAWCAFTSHWQSPLDWWSGITASTMVRFLPTPERCSNSAQHHWRSILSCDHHTSIEQSYQHHCIKFSTVFQETT